MKKKIRFLGLVQTHLGEVQLTETEQAIYNETFIKQHFNLSYDETVFNYPLKEIKEYLNEWSINDCKNELQVGLHKNIEYADWLLTELGCELDKKYSIEELKEMSGMTWDDFNLKINNMEKWDVNTKIPNPRKH